MLSFTEYTNQNKKSANVVTEKILDTLLSKGYDAHRTTKTGSIIRIYTDRPRQEIVEETLGIIENSYISPKKPTIVLVENTKTQIVIKPKDKGGIKSAGLNNEQALISGINQLVQEHGTINIRFVGSNGKNFECKGVTRALGTGYDTSNRKKADLVIIGDRDYPISLKKRNAEYWESSDSYFGEYARNIIMKNIKKGLVELVSVPGSIGAYKLSNEIIHKATREQTKDVCFGSDILGNGCIIQENFDTKLKYTISRSKWVEIPVTALFKTVADVMNDKDHAVWFLIRNDITRNSKTIGYRGIRVLATYFKRVKRHIKGT